MTPTTASVAKVWPARFGANVPISNASDVTNSAVMKTITTNNAIVLQSDEPFREFEPRHGTHVVNVDFNEDSSLFLSASRDGLVRIWDPESAAIVLEILVESPLSEAKFVPGRELVATSSIDGVIRFWSLSGGGQVGPDFNHSNTPKIQFPEEGRLFLTSYLEGDPGSGPPVRLRDLPITQPRCEMFRHWSDPKTPDSALEVAQIEFSPSGEELATLGILRKSVQLWGVRSRTLLNNWGMSGASEVVFHPDGNHLLIFGGAGAVLCGRPSSGEPWKIIRNFFQESGNTISLSV